MNILVQIFSEVRGLIISADQLKIKQILFNLLSNAAKFTPDGGSICIVAKKEGDNLVVSVSDTGIGINSVDQDRIFGEFEQAQSVVNRKQPGTGLGLALAKRLVELHHGQIWVHSEGKGKGSVFFFTIPLNLEADILPKKKRDQVGIKA